MIVLLTGATGFLGRHLAKVLVASRHEVICAVRDPGLHQPAPGIRYLQADFTRDLDPAAWLPRLRGVDVVINAAGILRESGSQRFSTIHVQGPRALFAACVMAGVKQVIQISALGADDQARSRYHLSKREADDFLRTLALSSVIVQPSLIYGRSGASARLFTTLASLPVIGLPSGGRQLIQPVHVDDAVEAILALIGNTGYAGKTVPVVGPEPLTFRAFLGALRQAMGLGRPIIVPIPFFLMRAGAAVSQILPGSLLDADTLHMLERGNTGDPEAIRSLLGRAPRGVDRFIPEGDVDQVRLRAQLNWLLPLLRFSIAAVWIVTGILSFGVYPVADSYALLARVGIAGALAPVMLYGAALLDLVFGFATLFWKRRHWLWVAQLSLILLYTALITLRLPEFWLHPYGPILKNLPMLAAILLVMELERRPWTT